MVKLNAKRVPQNTFSIGEFDLRLDPERGKVWIIHANGEGGEFDLQKFEAAVRKFYEENF